MKKKNYGFTLIEMMIVVAIIGILAAIAYPSYTDYLRRGAIPEGVSALSDGRIKMEQFFMDNRTYNNACGRLFPANTTAGKFSITCTFTPATGGATPVAESYTLTATGSGIVNSFIYTIDNLGDRATSSTGVWAKTNAQCWILKQDGSCQ